MVTFLSVPALALIALPLLSQDSYLRTDSILTLDFTSPSDSVYVQRTVHAMFDSAEVVETSTVCRWDPVAATWVNREKETRKLDGAGNAVLTESFRWDVDQSGWMIESREEANYDGSGRQTGKAAYAWSDAEQGLVGTSRYVYEFDTAGNLALVTRYSWDLPGGGWVNESLKETQYDTLGNPEYLAEYAWNAAAEVWDTTNRVRYAYELDALDRITTRIQYDWAGTWVPEVKNVYTWDPGDHQVLKIDYVWNDPDGWQEDKRQETVYDDGGNQTLNAWFSWDSGVGDWVGQWKDEMEFNGPGWLIHKRSFACRPGTYDWLVVQSIEYLYHPSGFRTAQLNWSVDHLMNDSAVYRKTWYYPAGYRISQYDTICDGTGLVWQGQVLEGEGIHRADWLSSLGADSIYYMHLTLNPAPGSFEISGDTMMFEGETGLYTVPENSEVTYRWVVENGNVLSGDSAGALEVEWGPPDEGLMAVYAENLYGCRSDTAILVVHIGLTGMEDPASLQLMLYPVPVKHILRISSGMDFPQVEIIDARGHCVRSASGPAIDLSGLESGVYLVRIKDNAGVPVATRRIVKE